MIKFVGTCELLGNMIGCFTSNGDDDFSSLLPILSNPVSSRKGTNLRRGLFFTSLRFPSWRLSLVISSSEAVRCTSLRVSILASRRSATVVVTVLDLFFLKGLFRYDTTPTALSQLENLDTVDKAAEFFDLSHAYSGFNFWVSNLNVGNPFFARRDFLLPEKRRSIEPVRFHQLFRI